MQVWRLNDHDGPGGFIVDDPSQLAEELGGGGVGDHYHVFIEEMDPAEFHALPEFDGF